MREEVVAGGGGGGGEGLGHLDVQLGTFDVILASEILYRPEHYETLCSLFGKLLAPGGSAFLGTKRFYFGQDLRGGSAAFCTAARAFGFGVDLVAGAGGDGLARDVLQVRLLGSSNNL